MRKPELNRITAALRNLTPMQRRVVATEWEVLDAQPASTVIIEGRIAAIDRKPRKRGGRASQRGLSHEQVPVLVARDRGGARWIVS